MNLQKKFEDITCSEKKADKDIRPVNKLYRYKAFKKEVEPNRRRCKYIVFNFDNCLSLWFGHYILFSFNRWHLGKERISSYFPVLWRPQ